MKTSEGSRKPPTGKPPVPSANSLVSNEYGGNPVKCVYCKEYHYSASCERVKGPNKRKKILAKERRCLNCSRPGNVVSVCKNMKVCLHCGESHHQSICPSLSRSRSDEKPTTSPPDRMSAIQPQPTQFEIRELFFYKQRKLQPAMKTTRNQHMCVFYLSFRSEFTANLKPRFAVIRLWFDVQT